MKLSAAWLMILVIFVPTLVAGEPIEPPAVADLVFAPIRLSGSGEAPGSSRRPGQPAGLAFQVFNRSHQAITRIGVEAVVFSPDGAPKGFHVFQMPAWIQPGEQVYASYASVQLPVSREDRVVLLPYSAEGPRLRWRLPDADLHELTVALARERGDVAAAELSSVQKELEPQNPPPPPDPGGSGGGSGCLSLCENAYSTCTSTCSPCGVASTSCSCSSGSLSISCACQSCRQQ